MGETGALMAVEKKAVTDGKLQEIDKLRLQNAFLKWHALNTQSVSIRTQFEVLRRDAARVDQESVEAQKTLETVREEIAGRYNIDLKKTTVDQDGNFVPLRPGQVPFPVAGGNGG
jgi:hypothetical protein